MYVGDVVAAFLAAADRGRPGTWNIGTGLEVSVLDLVEIIALIAGPKADAGARPGAPGRAGPQRAGGGPGRRRFGWRAATPLAEGIRRVYQWIKAGHSDRLSLLGAAPRIS